MSLGNTPAGRNQRGRQPVRDDCTRTDGTQGAPRRPLPSARVVGAIVLACSIAGAAHAKLPAADDQGKAKAAEAKVKSDEAAKHQAEMLVKAQDRVADRYKRTKSTSPKR